MRQVILVIAVLLCFSCESQNRSKTAAVKVGGPCEGCEAIFEYGDRKLSAVDTLPDFEANEPKLKITGVVYENDGKTPAKDVILYIYHTNANGIYPKAQNATGWAQRHGYLRGWIKTGVDGRYTFYTFRPASYPNTTISQHIHITVKEPDKNEYYIDDFLFDDDPFLTKAERKNRPNRGGSGIFLPVKRGDIFLIERDIRLGLNIPDYD